MWPCTRECFLKSEKNLNDKVTSTVNFFDWRSEFTTSTKMKRRKIWIKNTQLHHVILPTTYGDASKYFDVSCIQPMLNTNCDAILVQHKFFMSNSSHVDVFSN
jgi:hypothetical protein